MGTTDIFVGVALGAGLLYGLYLIDNRRVVPPMPPPCPLGQAYDSTIPGCSPYPCGVALCPPDMKWNWCVKQCVPAGSMMPDCPPPGICGGPIPL